MSGVDGTSGTGNGLRSLWGWALAALVLLVWSVIGCADVGTWAFEILPGTLAFALLLGIAPRFRFTTLVFAIALVHLAVLAIGAKYTYALVPLDPVMELFGLERNPFDRVGHFMQGVTPALVTRELALRRARMAHGWLLRIFATSVALAFSALYEILEMLMVLVFYPDEGPEWLGMQGDVWDAQRGLLP